MPNFAVAASKEFIEKANRVMEVYYRDGDKKEDTLLRIMDVAEKESIRGTHPEIEKNLQGVDETISILIKQINGVVAGQDLKLNEYKAKFEAVLTEKNEALQDKISAERFAKEACDAAEARVNEAISDVKRIKSETEKEIKLAMLEREQSHKEAETAKKLTEETTRSYSLLLSQMNNLEDELKVKKEVEEKNAEMERKIQSMEKELLQMREEVKYKNSENERLYSEVQSVKSDSEKFREVEKEKLKIEEELKYKFSEVEKYQEEIGGLRIELKEYKEAVAKLQTELQISMQKNVDAAEKAMQTERALRDQIRELEVAVTALKHINKR